MPNIVDFAKSVGFTSLDGQYGPAIAIGGVDLKPLDLTYGYTVIANGGVMAAWTWSRRRNRTSARSSPSQS